MKEYRRVKGSDTWHFCRNCTHWPTTNYESSQSKPTSGEFCNECLAKDKADNCKTN